MKKEIEYEENPWDDVKAENLKCPSPEVIAQINKIIELSKADSSNHSKEK